MRTLRKIVNFTLSDDYRARIHDLIPGGSHTYSKGDDQFCRRSPAAFTRGKGVTLWDLDGNEYLDCAMGLTSVSLGHAYEPVLARVRAALENGVNFQRPAAVEREMAECFLSRLPQHDMIKFAKNGSTATTAAVKIARAATGRDLVAFPGDHPFYSYDDWFIGKTACSLGVPAAIQELSVTFQGCDFASLESLFHEHPGRIACVISEPERSHCHSGACPCGGNPAGFVARAIELCERNGACFIMDEMITGYKRAFPGFMASHSLRPHMTTWGKSVANGFSFCALTGVKEVMELGGIRRSGQEKLFLISSTHGGETHSIAAGLATAEEFANRRVVDHLHAIGRSFLRRVEDILRSEQLAEFVAVTPCPWMPVLAFKDRDGKVCQGMRTLFMQEMIARGVLFQGALSPSFSHTENDLDYFQEAMREALQVYRRGLEDGYQAHLDGEPAKPVFRRLL